MLLLVSLLTAANAADYSNGEMPALESTLLRLSYDSDNFITTRDSSLREDGFSFERWVGFSDEQLVYVAGPNRDLLVNNLLHGYGLFAYTQGLIRVGLEVPYYLLNWGGHANDEAGLGDIALDAHIVALERADGPVGLSFGLKSVVPTSTMDAALGSKGWSGAADAAVDGEVAGIVWAVNAGVEWVPEVALESLDWGPRIFGHVGVSHDYSGEDGVALELFGRRQLTGEGMGGAPAEALLSWRHQFGPEGDAIRLGLGAGLLEGIGSSNMRFVLGWTAGQAFESASCAARCAAEKEGEEAAPVEEVTEEAPVEEAAAEEGAAEEAPAEGETAEEAPAEGEAAEEAPAEGEAAE